MSLRKTRRRRYPSRTGRKPKVKFLPIIIIICLSVCAGYLTAKYVVYPILGYEPTSLNILKHKTGETNQAETTTAQTETASETTGETTTQQTSESTEKPTVEQTTEKKAVVEDKVDVKQAAGYTLQFGSYSTKAAAQKAVSQLKASGITAKILKKDDSYKVVGQLFDTKSKAKAALEKMDESVGAFITTIDK